jgi:hypothetical protein
MRAAPFLDKSKRVARKTLLSENILYLNSYGCFEAVLIITTKIYLLERAW